MAIADTGRAGAFGRAAAEVNELGVRSEELFRSERCRQNILSEPVMKAL